MKYRIGLEKVECSIAKPDISTGYKHEHEHRVHEENIAVTVK